MKSSRYYSRKADAKGIFCFEELDRCPVEIQRGAAHIMLGLVRA